MAAYQHAEQIVKTNGWNIARHHDTNRSGCFCGLFTGTVNVLIYPGMEFIRHQKLIGNCLKSIP